MQANETERTLEVSTVTLDPLPCDRWLARSCFQKAVRRGDSKLAVRALANLFLHDPNAVWRHLTIIALEDVGVANLDILRAIVSAKHGHSIRRTAGLLWSTFVNLAERMAGSEHDQAICDLLLRVENDPTAGDQEITMDAGPDFWASVLSNAGSSMEQKAAAALCFGGFMEVKFPADPTAVFEIFSESAEGSDVSALARDAWKLSRNPMALLMPIVWSVRSQQSDNQVHDDPLFPAEWNHGVPDYGLDQFTRVGKSAIRTLTRQDLALQSILAGANVKQVHWPKVVGDLLFLVEGGLCVRRSVWREAEALRRPARWLPATALLGDALEPAIECMAAKVRELREIRRALIHRSRWEIACKDA